MSVKVSEQSCVLTAQACLQEFQSQANGLSVLQAQERLAKYGRNVLPQPKEPGFLLIFLRQFLNPLIYILFAAGSVALYLHGWHDAVFIFIVLISNALIGAFQEHSAQRSAQALKKLILVQAKVLREGKTLLMNAEELVPGDIVLLESGDKVPADLRLISTHGLEVDESLLTGESMPVLKEADIVLGAHAPLAERRNMAFMGTLAVRGRGQGLVVSTGLSTQLGEMAAFILWEKETKPPLMRRMESFTRGISLAVAGAVIVLVSVQMARGIEWTEIFFSAVALAVSAIPEGLPIAITVALAVGMRRMAKRHVIVRRLLAVEALGSCTCIASDKTGTLTINEMTVERVIFAGEDPWVRGTPILPSKQQLLARLAHAVVMCNEAQLVQVQGQWAMQGDSVDRALLAFADRLGLDHGGMKKKYIKMGMIPFESEEQFAAYFYQDGQAAAVAVKGALEKLLAMSDKMACAQGDVPIDVKVIEQQAHHLAREGYRVLAVAAGCPHPADNPFRKDALKHLTFLGLVGMIDPLRPEAAVAVEHCRQAGIRVAMVTGDHPVTALAIARQLKMAEHMEEVVTGTQLAAAEKRGPTHLDALTHKATVFARMEPKQKLLLVHSLARTGHFVAVTGDGANDAPALRAAHVGVAMGKRGTDVARESAQIVLSDDNFASIVAGVEEGRIAYANIRKVIFLLIPTGAAEIVLFALAVFSGLPLPLLPTQLLWLNLVTNGIQDVALAFEPAEGNELKRPPRRPKEAIFDRLMIRRILITGATMSLIAFFHYKGLLAAGWSPEAARNSVLLLMVLFENVHVINCRSEFRSFLSYNPLRNPFLFYGTFAAQLLHIGAMYTPGLRDVLGVQPVSLAHWAQMFGLALSVLLVIEIDKLLLKKENGHGKEKRKL